MCACVRVCVCDKSVTVSECTLQAWVHHHSANFHLSLSLSLSERRGEGGEEGGRDRDRDKERVCV